MRNYILNNYLRRENVRKVKIFMLFLMASESVKVLYERARRKRNSDERKVSQVLYPWLRILHPEVLMKFNGFYAQLKDRNEMSQEIRHVMAREQQHPQKLYK